MSEDKIQAQCYLWFHNTYPSLRGLLFHIPNGGSRHKSEAAKFKAIGVVSGIPDLCLCLNSRAYFFELKTTTGKQSQKQIEIGAKLTKQGFSVYLVRSFKEFQSIISETINKAL